MGPMRIAPLGTPRWRALRTRLGDGRRLMRGTVGRGGAQLFEPKRLCLYAYSRGAHDNLSVAIVYLQHLHAAKGVADWAAEVEGKGAAATTAAAAASSTPPGASSTPPGASSTPPGASSTPPGAPSTPPGEAAREGAPASATVPQPEEAAREGPPASEAASSTEPPPQPEEAAREGPPASSTEAAEAVVPSTDA